MPHDLAATIDLRVPPVPQCPVCGTQDAIIHVQCAAQEQITHLCVPGLLQWIGDQPWIWTTVTPGKV